MNDQTGQVIKLFPVREKSIREKIIRRQPKNSDGIKYFSEPQVKALRRLVRDKAATGRMTALREWMAVDVLTGSGLRVSECADLRCGSLKAGYGESSLFVSNGKGNKSRYVEIPNSLKLHLKAFIQWKRERGEPTGPDGFLFVGQRGPMTCAAIQGIVKKYFRLLGIYEPGRSAHSLRHSYAVEYYKRSGHDLKGLSRQLGHSSISTTGDIYVGVLREDIQENVRNLWN